MTQFLIFKLIAIMLLAFIAHDINIATLGLKKVKAIKSFANHSASAINKIFHSISSPK